MLGFHPHTTFSLTWLAIFQVRWSMVWGMTISDVSCLNDTPLTDLPFCLNIGYDKSTCPISDLPLNITIHVRLGNIVKVDDHENTITLTMKLSIYWIESRLKLNPNSSAWLFNDSLESVAGIKLKWFEYLWKSTLDMINIEKFQIRHLLKKQNSVYLHGNKMLSYHLPEDVVLNCPLFDFTLYPFDKQICELFIGSYDYHSGINVYKGDVLYGSIQPRHLQYHVSGVTPLSFEEGLTNMTRFYYTSNGKMQEMTHEFSYFAVRIKLTRRLFPHLIMTHLPSFLIVLSS
jgi:hypothetical protein